MPSTALFLGVISGSLFDMAAVRLLLCPKAVGLLTTAVVAVVVAVAVAVVAVVAVVVAVAVAVDVVAVPGSCSFVAVPKSSWS